MKNLLIIGKLAQACQINIETVRFYERKGILRQPKKQGAFRYYTDEYIAKICFIKRSQDLGFTLSEAHELLDLKIRDQAKCSDILSKTEEKISGINQKISDLKKMKESLKGLANCCVDDNQPLSDCPIFECFMDKRKNK